MILFFTSRIFAFSKSIIDVGFLSSLNISNLPSSTAYSKVIFPSESVCIFSVNRASSSVISINSSFIDPLSRSRYIFTKFLELDSFKKSTYGGKGIFGTTFTLALSKSTMAIL